MTPGGRQMMRKINGLVPAAAFLGASVITTVADTATPQRTGYYQIYNKQFGRLSEVLYTTDYQLQSPVNYDCPADVSNFYLYDVTYHLVLDEGMKDSIFIYVEALDVDDDFIETDPAIILKSAQGNILHCQDRDHDRNTEVLYLRDLDEPIVEGIYTIMIGSYYNPHGEHQLSIAPNRIGF